MLPVNLVFIFVAGVAFLGFILNVLFERTRIARVLPLMLIGLLIGPALHLVNTSSTGIASLLTPYITALTVALILFDVGINTNLKTLKTVFVKATTFTLLAQTVTGLTLSVIVYFAMHWTILECLIFGFAASGPSSIIIPAIVKEIDMSEKLKQSLVFESVITDMFQLIIPLMLIGFLLSSNLQVEYVGSVIFTSVVGGVMAGTIFAVLWLYVLNRFGEYSSEYSWMLTISTIIATYGIAEQLGLSGAITIFVFGLVFANIGLQNPEKGDKALPWIEKYLYVKTDVQHIREYQREIVFFTSTFFFVYIGVLFSFSDLSIEPILLGLGISIIMIAIRYGMSRMLKQYMSDDPKKYKMERSIISFNISRGLSTAVIATIPMSLGIVIPGFLNLVFIIILFTNIAPTIGLFLIYKPTNAKPSAKPNGKPKTESKN